MGAEVSGPKSRPGFGDLGCRGVISFTVACLTCLPAAYPFGVDKRVASSSILSLLYQHRQPELRGLVLMVRARAQHRC